MKARTRTRGTGVEWVGPLSRDRGEDMYVMDGHDMASRSGEKRQRTRQERARKQDEQCQQTNRGKGGSWRIFGRDTGGGRGPMQEEAKEEEEAATVEKVDF